MQPGCLHLSLGILLLSSLFAFLGCSGDAPESGDAKDSKGEANQTGSSGSSYPLDFCVVSGNDFGENSDMIPYLHVYKGTTIKFCCKPCLPRFEKDPERYLTFMNEEIEALAKEREAGSP